MMRHDQQLEAIQNTLIDANMELESETQEACKKAASIRHLKARRAIEELAAQKALERELKEFDFD